jgi:DNA-binding SARP family transcriptional activator
MCSQSTNGLIQALPPLDLSVYMLGSPRVEWQGHILSIARCQVRALLYRLATDPQPIQRSRLCFLFWPDLRESTARINLSRLVNLLHLALPIPNSLVAFDDQIGLDSQYTWSDVLSFDRFCRNLESHTPTIPQFEFINLYRGAFLDGFYLSGSIEYEAWVEQERQRTQHAFLCAIAVLIEQSINSGDYPTAIACASRYLAIDEFAEDIHRQLIQLYAVNGQRGAALRQYEYCATLLRNEYGTDPLPETRAVYQAIVQRRYPELNIPRINRHKAV